LKSPFVQTPSVLHPSSPDHLLLSKLKSLNRAESPSKFVKTTKKVNISIDLPGGKKNGGVFEQTGKIGLIENNGNLVEHNLKSEHLQNNRKAEYARLGGHMVLGEHRVLGKFQGPGENMQIGVNPSPSHHDLMAKGQMTYIRNMGHENKLDDGSEIIVVRGANDVGGMAEYGRGVSEHGGRRVGEHIVGDKKDGGLRGGRVVDALKDHSLERIFGRRGSSIGKKKEDEKKEEGSLKDDEDGKGHRKSISVAEKKFIDLKRAGGIGGTKKSWRATSKTKGEGNSMNISRKEEEERKKEIKKINERLGKSMISRSLLEEVIFSK
jgi:hypothetical protein